MAIQTLSVTTNGSGTGTATSEAIHGTIYGVQVTLGGTPAATTDITLTEAGGLQRNILTLTNYSTPASAVYNPQNEIDDTTGTGTTTYDPFVLAGETLTLTVAQGVASTANAVVVKVLYR